MALHDNPPHRITTYTVAPSRDAGGGTVLTYTAAQSALPCSIDTASASEQLMFGQQGMLVTHKIGILTSAITTAVTRGMKAVADDTGLAFHVEGIAAGRAYGTIPAFTYLFCSQVL